MESPEEFQPDPLYQRVAEAAVQNARDLLDASEAAASRGRYGSGRSLAILGLEEGAKAWVYRGAAMGMFTFDKAQAGRKRSVGGQEVELKFVISEKTLNSKHPEKHALDAGVEMTLAMMEGVFLALPRMLRGELNDSSEASEIFPGIAERIEGLAERAGSDNDRKNQGLYVRHEGDVVHSPRVITESDWKQYAARLHARLAFLGPFVESDVNADSGDALGKALFGRGWAVLEGLRGEAQKADPSREEPDEPPSELNP